MIQSTDQLDLQLLLDAPSGGAPTGTLASVALRCEALGLSHAGGWLQEPLSEREREDLRWYLEEYYQWPYDEYALRGEQVEELLVTLGKRLYQAVFAGAQDVLQAWRFAPTSQRQLSIVSTIPAVLSLPWELLHDEQGYLVLRTRQPVTLVRCLKQRELAALPVAFVPPLRVLVVTARPDDTGFLDPRGLAHELLDAVQPQIDAGTIAVEFLRPPTRAALRLRLRDTSRPVHLLHFDGHGVFQGDVEQEDRLRKQAGAQGMLAFEDAEGGLDLVKADDLAQLLQDSGVKLAVLDACQSAMGSAEDAFSSVAARLIRGGVDATVGMSASVLVPTSTRFFAAFYHELANGTAVPVAQERARQALYDDPRRHVFRQHDDDEGQPVELRDWWLPHYYQQRPLILRTAVETVPTAPAPTEQRVRFNEAMPSAPRYGFSGRSYELLMLERYLLHKRLVVLSGFGGVGKTALVREAADWLTRTGMYSTACFVSFEHGGDATLLLSELGTLLGINDGAYRSDQTDAALARLKAALRERPTLVIADNLESILPNGEAPLEPGVRTQLWRTLLELAGMGAGVLLTTRDTSFGDGLLAQGPQVAYIALKGLWPTDAYALATRLLTSLDIPRTRAPYVELRDLLVELDHHPLSIQLVLPALKAKRIDAIRREFSELLPDFVDDTTTGRNRSLLASLAYSLKRLTPEQAALLPRLAVFEGGASEDDLLAVTEIEETVWAQVRPALEQAALLSVEWVPGISVPFLRFHPVLTPFLRGQMKEGDEAERTARFAERYFAVAGYLRDQDRQHPQVVRTLVVKELPNLRRALELLVVAGNLEEATRVVDRLAYFLDRLGRGRERDILQQRMGEALAARTMSLQGTLTYAEYLHENGLGEEAWQRGNLSDAFMRLKALLNRMEALPEGAALGPGSYEYCVVFLHLARCYRDERQPAESERLLRLALANVEKLLQQVPEHVSYAQLQSTLFTDLADMLQEQGKYAQARAMYERGLEIAKQLGDVRGQAVSELQLGILALVQREYSEARKRYQEALHAFQSLNEPAMEAVAWHQLGMVAEEQEQWIEAERCYRASLAIKERMGDTASAATTCNQLANVVYRAGRPVEREGWYRRAVDYDAQANPGHPKAMYLSNLAVVLIDEVEAGRALSGRLAEAKQLAEQALSIRQTQDASSEIWMTLGILARIADLEQQPEAAQSYRRRERETFAAFAGNRYHIDQQHGALITNIAAAARGETSAREVVEARLPALEANGWHIAEATQRLWAGERDWHALTQELDRQDALLILRVLETLAEPTDAETPTTPPTAESLIASLPAAVREALAQGDQAAFAQALTALDPAEQQRVLPILQTLQTLAEEDDGETEA